MNFTITTIPVDGEGQGVDMDADELATLIESALENLSVGNGIFLACTEVSSLD